MTHCAFEPENPTKRHGNECKLQSTVDASSGIAARNNNQTSSKPRSNRLGQSYASKIKKTHSSAAELFWVKVYSCYNFSLGPNVERQIINFPLAPSHFTCASSFKGDYASTCLLLSYTPLQCAYGESFGKELVRSNR